MEGFFRFPSASFFHPLNPVKKKWGLPSRTLTCSRHPLSVATGWTELLFLELTHLDYIYFLHSLRSSTFYLCRYFHSLFYFLLPSHRHRKISRPSLTFVFIEFTTVSSIRMHSLQDKKRYFSPFLFLYV